MVLGILSGILIYYTATNKILSSLFCFLGIVASFSVKQLKKGGVITLIPVIGWLAFYFGGTITGILTSVLSVLITIFLNKNNKSITNYFISYTPFIFLLAAVFIFRDYFFFFYNNPLFLIPVGSIMQIVFSKMFFNIFPHNLFFVFLSWLGYAMLTYTISLFILTNGSLGLLVSIGIMLITIKYAILSGRNFGDYQRKINTLSLQNNLVSGLYNTNNQLPLYFQEKSEIWGMNGLPAPIAPLSTGNSLFTFNKFGDWFSISTKKVTFVTNLSTAEKLESLTKHDLIDTLDLLETVWKTSFMKRRLENAFLGAASMFIRLTDRKDSDTHHHSLRVSAIAVQLASKLKLPTNLLFELKIGALLHDIGKLVIPARIIKKKGLLTQNERNLIETHPFAGLKLVGPLKNYRSASSVVAQHHEHINGTGYPLGIAGKEISLCARIVAVADTFDAITSPRAYHLGKSKYSAFNIIEESAGTHYDVNVVKALGEILNEL